MKTKKTRATKAKTPAKPKQAQVRSKAGDEDVFGLHLV